MSTTKTNQPRKLGRALALALLGQGLALGAAAHGYLTQPEARGFLCRGGTNSQCGPIQWEPQSLEGYSGYPDRGPSDGQIASAGLTQFGALDEQSAVRWTKRPLSAGLQNFSWTFTANHVTRNFRYYITRQDWNPNLRLSRSSFEAQPFCSHDGGMRQPPKQLTHACQVPARQGYQVILAVWEVGDTPMSFYNVADVVFQNGGGTTTPLPGWESRGVLHPSADLGVGDQVMTRVFDARGERRELQTRLRIVNSADGLRDSWPYLLAQRINAEQPRLLQAGMRAADGRIAPAPGRNEVFAQPASGIERVELQIEKAPAPAADLLINGLNSSPSIVNGQLSLAFALTAVGEMDITATVLDHSGRTKGTLSLALNNSGQSVQLPLQQPQPGHHQLVLRGVVKGSGALVQKTLDLMIGGGTSQPGPAQYRFPEGLRDYKPGTLVQQPKDGRVYECRAWPNSGYCTQWTANAPQFEPGIGSHWRDAWIQR
ncbi:N-acetylglucosamine-binding protein GbpA [Roseateles sp. DAIF2]|uniref:N-acetylglucosamine-binding protein GbpA n=1 Tax=Roseateles sp. DAIF2 TaxID=2714952 RepID=UPI0018A253D9|nr:N-acetylglucosamine-binding protein GbpA [Roseateles sp. DAIF2]QPF73008.1 N-acetylglucosamine-binding protein GbpA [Roseateles sp. DAIF2]